MNILLIGYTAEIDFVSNNINTSLEQITISTLTLTNHSGIEMFSHDYLSLFDKLILCIEDKPTCNSTYTILSSILGNDDNILDFYQLYQLPIPIMNVDIAMTNPLYHTYDGMILGISHSEVGILPELLPGNCCNLAVSSQDLYYNVKTLEYCLSNYYTKIANLKYAVIDMYDYTYFNYDVSQSKNAIYYYTWGGYYNDLHNYHENKSCKYDFDIVLSNLKRSKTNHSTSGKIQLFDLLFNDIHKKNNYEQYKSPTIVKDIHRRMTQITSVPSADTLTKTSIVTKYFQSTLKENILLFDILLESLYAINPNIQVYTIIMPRYSEFQNKIDYAYTEWKQIFTEIIVSAQKKYPFQHMDFRKDELSSRRECFFDVSHLNYYGAMLFTKKLRSLLES